MDSSSSSSSSSRPQEKREKKKPQKKKLKAMKISNFFRPVPGQVQEPKSDALDVEMENEEKPNTRKSRFCTFVVWS